jgi:hypothetical protein
MSCRRNFPHCRSAHPLAWRFVGFTPRITAFERWEISQIAVGVPLDRKIICSSIYFHIFSVILYAYVLCANIDTLKKRVCKNI